MLKVLAKDLITQAFYLLLRVFRVKEPWVAVHPHISSLGSFHYGGWEFWKIYATEGNIIIR